MVDWEDLLEKSWDEFKDKIYYILGVVFILSVPFIIGAQYPEGQNLSKIPLLTDLYALLREIGLDWDNRYFLSILTLCAIWAIFAASYDLLSGYTGQFSFGHAIFFGISAYFAMWFSGGVPSLGNMPILGPIFQLDVGYAILLSMVVSVIVALVIGAITLRIRGPYFALVTLVIPLIASQLATIYKDITGGENGVGLFARDGSPLLLLPEMGPQPLDIRTEWEWVFTFYVFVVIMLVSVAIMALIAYSRFGLAFQAVREDEFAAVALGIDVSKYKVFAFGVSAFFGGLAGALYSQYKVFVGPSFFVPEISFPVIIMVVMGGMGSIYGGVLGAFALTILTRLFLLEIFNINETPSLDILLYALLLIVSIRYLPQGITRASRRLKRALTLGIVFAIGFLVLTHFFAVVETPFLPIFEFLRFFGVESNPKSNFLVYFLIGVPAVFYSPDGFKAIRLKFWGVWPSMGRYEDD